MLLDLIFAKAGLTSLWKIFFSVFLTGFKSNFWCFSGLERSLDERQTNRLHLVRSISQAQLQFIYDFNLER